MEKETDIIEKVKDYYGKVLSGTKDLKTNACCTDASMPEYLKGYINNIHPEIFEKFYGCGSPLPAELAGCTVLDLGCGTGRDSYLVSQLVGPKGDVIGIDMTEEQLEVARRHINFHMEKFGYAKPNVEFKQGYIEDLHTAGIEDNSIDVVISNCVINLSPDKQSVFSEIFRVLKPGGELYFSDVFSGRRVPPHLMVDPVLYGECLSGALYVEDFRRMLQEVGCLDYRTVKKSPITINNPELEKRAGMVDFYSVTVRAFKLDTLEDICEDYGQLATYKGTIEAFPHSFELDDHHLFLTGKPTLVCGNTTSMLEETRYARHFKIVGDRTTHFGPFDCAPFISSQSGGDAAGACC